MCRRRLTAISRSGWLDLSFLPQVGNAGWDGGGSAAIDEGSKDSGVLIEGQVALIDIDKGYFLLTKEKTEINYGINRVSIAGI